MKISRISSRLTPLVSAPLMCARNSCGRLRIEIIARLSMLRVLRGSSSRPHTAPQQYSVTSSWNGLLKLVGVLQGVVDIGLAEHRFANFQSLVVCLLVHVHVSLRIFTVPATTLRGSSGRPQSRLRVMRISRCGYPPEAGCLNAAAVLVICRQPGEFIERRSP